MNSTFEMDSVDYSDSSMNWFCFEEEIFLLVDLEVEFRLTIELYSTDRLTRNRLFDSKRTENKQKK